MDRPADPHHNPGREQDVPVQLPRLPGDQQARLVRIRYVRHTGKNIDKNASTSQFRYSWAKVAFLWPDGCNQFWVFTDGSPPKSGIFRSLGPKLGIFRPPRPKLTIMKLDES